MGDEDWPDRYRSNEEEKLHRTPAIYSHTYSYNIASSAANVVPPTGSCCCECGSGKIKWSRSGSCSLCKGDVLKRFESPPICNKAMSWYLSSSLRLLVIGSAAR